MATPPTIHYPRSLHSGFLKHEATHPDFVALSVGGREYTYAEVGETARRWAGALREAEGGRPSRVAVLGYRSHTSYTAVLAALLAGAAFVPLNPRFPVARNRAMLERAQVDALIVDAADAAALPGLLDGLARDPAVLLPDTETLSLPEHSVRPVLLRPDLERFAPTDELPRTDPCDMAYLLFTSGSTGVPKGVPISHGNVRAFLDVNQDRYRLTASDRLTQTFDQTFDLSVFDLFMAWDNGARVCAIEPIELLSPYDFLGRNRVTVWFSVPSAAAVLLKRGSLRPGRMPTLRWSLFCGEALPQRIAEAWQAAAPSSIVENLYGPTELTIACSAYRWDPASSPQECHNDLVPIGRPYPGMIPLIVDERLESVAAGESGELCLAGPQRFAGYWRAPELTAERCLERDGLTYYRTGDMVRAVRAADGPDADLLFLGRNDQQVKVGGYRIELGEVEAALRSAGSVEAVCLVHPEREEIVAFVSGGRTQELLASVSGRLPAYMIPRSIHALEDMPRSSSGKIDRNALRRSLISSSEGCRVVHAR
ncbi:amino acid adenylation domain-containing protein [Streptomyces sp. NPDC007205]|uniref:amino acid adenylation domain-containing protein n=1 Tax=Streptomyces sp. NPDC007205 TaxID=3154316 RepID=UPI0033FEB21D